MGGRSMALLVDFAFSAFAFVLDGAGPLVFYLVSFVESTIFPLALLDKVAFAIVLFSLSVEFPFFPFAFVQEPTLETELHTLTMGFVALDITDI
jgi:hypothetical protein